MPADSEDRKSGVSEWHTNFCSSNKLFGVVFSSYQPHLKRHTTVAVRASRRVAVLLSYAQQHGLLYVSVLPPSALRRRRCAAARSSLYTEMHFFSAIIIVITCHSITNTIRPLLPASCTPALLFVCCLAYIRFEAKQSKPCQ